jgi:phthalate 4,5-dioxygenase reductase subunit
VHFESFGASAAQQVSNSPFQIKLSQSQALLPVAADESILEALRKAGHRVPSSCESGTCGSCKTGLVAGQVEHRDFVLTDREKLNHIMVCVSRASHPNDVIEIDL